MYTCREYAPVVFDRREAANVKGVDKERSRYNCRIVASKWVDLDLDKVTTKHIRDWERELRLAYAFKKGPGRELTDQLLDPQTINRCLSTASSIFADAVENELIEKNPVIGAKLRKMKTEGDTIVRWSYLTPEEQKSILICEDIPKHVKLAAEFAWETGARQGEQMNAFLKDLIVDGPDPRFIIRHSTPFRGKLMPPKNGKIREVPLGGRALEVAREWLEYLPTWAPENPHNLVFPLASGARRNPGKPLGRSYSVHDMYDAAGIPARRGLHWHALRHTFATNLISGAHGRDPVRVEVIQELMGHHSVIMTARYAHMRKDAIRAELYGATVVAPKPAIIEEVVEAAAPLPLAPMVLVGANDGADRKRVFARGAELVAKHLDKVRKPRELFAKLFGRRPAKEAVVTRAA